MRRGLTFDPDAFVEQDGDAVLCAALVRVAAEALGLKVSRQEVLRPLADPDDVPLPPPPLRRLALLDMVGRPEAAQVGDEGGVGGGVVAREAGEEVVCAVAFAVEDEVEVGMDEEGQQERHKRRSVDVERLCTVRDLTGREGIEDGRC